MLISVTNSRMAARNPTMSSRSGSSGLTAGSCSANSSSSPIRPRRRSGVARRQLPARCSYLARTAVTFKRHAPLNRNEPPTSRSPAGRDRLSVAADGDARSNWRSSGAHWLTVEHEPGVSWSIQGERLSEHERGGPEPFGHRVSHQTQEPPFKFPPAKPAIRQRASWCTTDVPLFLCRGVSPACCGPVAPSRRRTLGRCDHW
jgi:hypothetical protein